MRRMSSRQTKERRKFHNEESNSHSITNIVRQWNKVKCQLYETRWFYWCILSSTCFGYMRPSSGALDVEEQHMVFCTEFLDGWCSWQPLRSSCVRCGWCRAALSAPYTRPTQRLSRPPPIHKTLCREPYAATQHLVLLMMGVCTRNI